MASQTQLLEQIEYKNKVLGDKDYHGQITALIGDTDDEDLDLKLHIIDEKYKAQDIYGDSKLTQTYKEVSDAGADFAYLIGINYDSEAEKYKKLIKAYKILEHIDVDIISLVSLEVDDFIYDYPEIDDEVEINFNLQAVDNGNLISSKNILATIDTSKQQQQISEYPVNRYFAVNDSYVTRSLSYTTASEFESIKDDQFSEHIKIDTTDDLIKPEKYDTYRDKQGRINVYDGYYAKSYFCFKEFDAEKIFKPDSWFDNVEINFDGDFEAVGSTKNIEFTYWDGKEFKTIPLQEVIKKGINFVQPIQKTKFLLKLENTDYIDPPVVNKIEFKFEMLTKNNSIEYSISNNDSTINLWTQPDGKDYVYANFDKEKYINQNTVKKYFVTKLAEYCSKNNWIGLVKAPSQKKNEDDEDWYNRLINSIKKVKYILNDDFDYGRHIGCLLSEVFYYRGSDRYLGHSLGAYTGLLASLETNQSPTNKNVDNISGLEQQFSDSEVEALNEAGYINFIKTIRQGIVPFRSTSLSSCPDTVYTSINTVRNINEVLNRVKNETDELVGKGIKIAEERINEVVGELLDDIYSEDKIQDYSYQIVEANKTYIEVEISITPFDEIFDITARTVSSS